MSEPASTPKKKAAKKKPSKGHPNYIDMISAAIVALKDRGGSSRQAIVKYIQSNYKVGENSGRYIKAALIHGVESKTLTRTKGAGAAGSFKLTPKAPAAKKSAKPAGPKKPAAKKTAKKVVAKKTAAKKAVKKTAAPKSKKATKKATKKPTAKKPVAKKAAKKTPKKTVKKGKK